MKHNIALSIISAVCLVPVLFSCAYDNLIPDRMEPTIEVWEKDGNLVAELDAVADVGDNSLHFYILDGKGKSWRINSLCSYEGASNYHMWFGNYENLNLTPNTEYQYYAELTLGRNTFSSVTRTFTTDSEYSYEYVDLGLSVKWATCNLGATKPEEYGGYYLWGGLVDVTSLYWDNSLYHSGTDFYTGWTKYIPSCYSSYWSGSDNPDNKTVLDPSDDVAHVKLGSKWRIPTYDDWRELIDNCTWTWTTQNGISGCKVTSNKSGYTSKSIFLPITGCYIYGEFTGYGGVFYWSSSLDSDYPDSVQGLYCVSDRLDVYSIFGRWYGVPVRPVYGDRVSVKGVGLNKISLSLNIGDTYTFSATVSPFNAAEKSVSWSSNNTSVATVDQNGKVTALKAGSATITVKTTDGSYTATCKVTVDSSIPVEVPEAIDLGLSVKWATCNIGASKPEEFGSYYQWAGLEDVTSTSIYLYWNNCPYHTGSDGKTGWTKYVPSDYSSYWSGSGNPDNKTALDPEDDVAHVKLGGKWRMPTYAEWSELISNCTWTWTTQNGVNGYKVTSKKSGYTSKSIFLPAAGDRYMDYLDDVGFYGYYWSSSQLTGNEPSFACNVFFSSDKVGWNNYSRCVGRPVRPVSE